MSDALTSLLASLQSRAENAHAAPSIGREEIALLVAECEKLRMDTERLDWLATQHFTSESHPLGKIDRAAIDAARKYDATE